MSINDIDDQSSIDGWTQNNSTDESETNNSIPSSASDLTWLRNDLHSISEKMDILISSIQHAHNDSYEHHEELVEKIIKGVGSSIIIGSLLIATAMLYRTSK